MHANLVTLLDSWGCADEVRRPGTLSYYWIAAVKQGGLPGVVFFLMVVSVLYMLYDAHARKMKRGGGKKRR